MHKPHRARAAWRCAALLGLLTIAAQPAFSATDSARHHHQTHKRSLAKADRDAGQASRAANGQVGVASYYSSRFAGRRTASGERFNPGELTAAHNSLPIGSLARVTNLRNGKSVVVRINDRGGFQRHGRLVDLSPAAAREIGLTHQGLARVAVKRIDSDS